MRKLWRLLPKKSAMALAIQSDSGKVREIEAAMQKINQRFGRIDALFVNAGVAKFVPFEEVTEQFFDETIATGRMYLNADDILKVVLDAFQFVLVSI
jgi:NAD(P)-dependent dehydrogenase (short-subunit alcohol dehydrogenase family)